MSITSTILTLAADAGHAETPGLLSLEVSLIVWTWVSFLLLLVLLSKFAWGPIQKLLKERADKIQGEIERARQMREDAEKALQDYNAKIEAIRKEAEEIREEARKQGDELKKQLEAKGNEAAVEIRERAQKEVDLMVNKARSELQTLAADLALQAAATVVGRVLTDDDHKRYAEEAIAALGTNSN